MAQFGFAFDATQVEPNAPFEVLPAGKYHVQIVNSEMRETKNGNGNFLWLDMQIIDGEHAGKHVFDRLNLINPNAQAVEIAQRTLSAICRATGQMSVSDSEQLHNRSMIATVKVRPAGPDKGGIQRDASNEVGGYEAMSGSVPTMQARPVTAPMQGKVHSAASAGAVAHVAEPQKTAPWKRQG